MTVRAVLVPVAIVTGSFMVMEGASYLTHRYVMHGFGRGWHRSHHAPASGGFERNDRFPLCFSVVAFLLFFTGAVWPGIAPLFWVGVGVSLYGALYLFVHELYIHRRAGVPMPRLTYLEWLRESHALHHRFGGEPYGMLAPVVGRSLRARAAARDGAGQPLDRSGRERDLRNTRETRARL